MIRRRKRWHVLLPAATAIAAVVAIVRIANSELIIHGRPLLHWLDVSLIYRKENEGEATNAIAIVRESGTAAIPHLLDLLETLPGWRERWNDFAIGRGWEWTFGVREAGELRERAVWGFEILGTNGVSAIPELRKLMRDDRYAADVARVLGHIQSDEAMDMLIALLKHPDSKVRYWTLGTLCSFEDRSRISRATNDFVRLVDDSNEETAWIAIRAVAASLPASQAIPVLTNKFSHPNPKIVRSAVGAFYGAGPHAEPVMPAIATLLTHPDKITRTLATNTLITINPNRAGEFGVITNGATERYFRHYHRVRQEFATNPVPYL